jgi:hypothetical protein
MRLRISFPICRAIPKSQHLVEIEHSVNYQSLLPVA